MKKKNIILHGRRRNKIEKYFALVYCAVLCYNVLVGLHRSEQTVLNGMVWYGMVLQVLYGKVWYCIVWYGMVRYDMV